MNLAAQILSDCITKTAATRALCSVEDQVRARKVDQKEFDAARATIEAIEPLYLYLACDLPQEEVTKIAQKLRKDYGKDFLIETKVQPELIGGCAMSYKGVYKDYSLKGKIQNLKFKI